MNSCALPLTQVAPDSLSAHSWAGASLGPQRNPPTDSPSLALTFTAHDPNQHARPTFSWGEAGQPWHAGLELQIQMLSTATSLCDLGQITSSLQVSLLAGISANPSNARTYSCLAPLVRATSGQSLEGWSHQHLSTSPNLGHV